MPPAGFSAEEPLLRIVVAFLAGMLIGIEREKARAATARRKRGRATGVEELVVKEFPGIRTFSLVAIYAAVLGYLSSTSLAPTALVVTLLAVFGLVIVVFEAYRLMVARMAGITTIVVLLVDFVIGLLSGLGEILLAVSTAVLTTFVLAIKLPAERVVGRIRYEELLWALELGVVILVVGPFFLESNASFYGVSLRSLYLFFALVLTTSYLGYVAARLMGGRGLAYTALFGGLANSEATLMALLQLLGPSGAALAFDITILTNVAMVVRNLAIAAAAAYTVSQETWLTAVLPLALASAAAAAPGFYAWRRSLERLVGETPEIENPLRFRAALKTTLLYLAIAFLSYLVESTGVGGLAIVAALGGFVSSSAAILAIYSIGLRDPLLLGKLAVIATIAGLLNKPIYAHAGLADPRATRRSLAASALQAALALAAVLPLAL